MIFGKGFSMGLGGIDNLPTFTDNSAPKGKQSYIVLRTTFRTDYCHA